MTVAWRLDGACPVCGWGTMAVMALPWPQFQHLDFTVAAPAPTHVLECPRCGAAGCIPAIRGTSLQLAFDTEDYALRDLPIHQVMDPATGQQVPAPDRQVDLLAGGLTVEPAILDIGCFDGRLLKSFQRRWPRARLVGFDVSRHMGSYFPQAGGITFTTDLGGIQGPFDLVTLSHSVQYEPDLNGLLQRVAGWLAPMGRLFIQVPDLLSKPASLLLGDLHHHFCAGSLGNVLAWNGFAADILADTGFPRDVLAVARPVRPSPGLGPVTAMLPQAVARLTAMTENLRALVPDGPWHVLGSTIDAAFVGTLLGPRRLAGFLDEAPGKTGEMFLGVPVRHPRELTGDDRTLLPLGPSATQVLDRFRASYGGTFQLL